MSEFLESEFIAIIAILIAIISAIYTRRAWTESQKANSLIRLQMLLALKDHYSKLMKKEIEKADAWGQDDSYAQACRNDYADYQIKYRDVTKELEKKHKDVVENKM